MKMIHSSIVCLFVLFLTAPTINAQDLSKYRTFSLGTNVAEVLKHTDQRPTDVKVIHGAPSFQELTWWPSPLGAPLRSDGVEEMIFSFYNGELYKIAVTYDRESTKGLTAADMTKAISAKYGPPTNIVLEIDTAVTEPYGFMGKGVASWEDPQYSLDLVRSSFVDSFGLVIYSKRANAEAELAIANAKKVDEQEGPQREVERQKKEADDLEVTRQKNRKVFQP